jgi:hypothetical protein
MDPGIASVIAALIGASAAVAVALISRPRRNEPAKGPVYKSGAIRELAQRPIPGEKEKAPVNTIQKASFTKRTLLLFFYVVAGILGTFAFFALGFALASIVAVHTFAKLDQVVFNLLQIVGGLIGGAAFLVPTITAARAHFSRISN